VLLESGSTPATRKAAAQQLGEVQRLHPHELPFILSRVHKCLRSNTWETRVAAGQAVEAILSKVPQWSFPPFLSAKVKKKEN
jgi:TATA-binding protein-associated factor